MNNMLRVEVIVEGPTENEFITKVLAPYWWPRGIVVEAPIVRTRIDKQAGRVFKGGDIRFERVAPQVGNFLKQRQDLVVATFVDFYGIKEWPGLDAISPQHTPRDIAQILNQAAKDSIQQRFPEANPRERYLPFTAMHEFEALLFSSPAILASHLNIQPSAVEAVLKDCGAPEHINNSPDTAPSKRLDTWAYGHYGKTTTGIAIAKEIGIDAMRQACPLFNEWLESIETRL